MIRLWHIIIFVVAFALFAVARAPASLIIPQRPGVLTYASAEGTIWRARFVGLRIGALDAGEALWRLSFRDLTQGKFVARIDLSGGDMVGDATLLGNWRGDRRLVSNSLHLRGAPSSPQLALPGVTTIGNLDIFFSGGRCVSAQGSLFSDVLVRTSSLWRWDGPPLRGAAICADAVARLDLSGAGETGGVRAVLDLSPDGRGVWRVEVRTDRPEAGAALQAAGFASEAGAFRLSREVRWAPF
jgi:hypothetical protein